jgi:hypothetical protein
MSALLPTPWEPVGNRSVRCAFEAGNAEKPGFEVATVPMFLPSDEAGRVARLIAAAPELLEALKALQNYAANNPRSGSHHDPVWVQVAEAIAKAEGRQ